MGGWSPVGGPIPGFDPGPSDHRPCRSLQGPSSPARASIRIPGHYRTPAGARLARASESADRPVVAAKPAPDLAEPAKFTGARIDQAAGPFLDPLAVGRQPGVAQGPLEPELRDL